jgi:hypothetical protein
MTIGTGSETQIRKPAEVPASAPTASDGSVSSIELYRVYRGQVEHEDNLLGSRINVFVTSQSFLFSAYAIIANTATPRIFGAPLDPKHVLLILIPIVAITTAILYMPAIAGSVLALRRIRDRYRRITHFPPDDCCHELPPLQGARDTRVAGTLASALLPPLFMGVWGYLFFERLF